MARVGLLEDNARIAKLCATMLQFSGHSVEIYEHPRTCLKALMPSFVRSEGKVSTSFSCELDLPIEVLILDLQLPEMPGVDVLRHLKSHAHTRNLPLIFCTASNPSEISQALYVAPHATVVEKPFKLDVLVSAVVSALSTRKV